MSSNGNLSFSSPLDNQKGSRTGTFLGKISFLDVFAFEPIPVHSPEKKSSKRSTIGSMLLVLLMLSYVISTFVTFLTNNVPKAQENKSIGNQIFTMPNISLTYIPNMDEGISVVDQSYYGVDIVQGISYGGLTTKRNQSTLGTDYNCNPTWLTGMNFTSFLCPAQLGTLEGNLLTTPQFSFIKITIYSCVNGSNPGIVCQDNTTIQNFLQTGRFFLFIQQDATFYNTQINAVKALFYFANFQLSQSYEIYLQNEEITLNPDYFYRFRTQTKQALFYLREKTYIDQLSPGAENQLITIWLRLNEESIIQEQIPETIMNLIGGWGALWGVMVSFCAFYFLRHNRKKFYSKFPKWQNFGQVTGDKDIENPTPSVDRSIELPPLRNEHI